MNIDVVFDVSQHVLEALKAEHTKESLDRILGLTDDVREKVVTMFHIAEDAADDVVEIALIAMSTLERVRDATFASRSIIKPAKQMTTIDDVTAVTVMQYARSLDAQRGPA